MHVSPTTVHRIMSSIGPSLPKSCGGHPAKLKAQDQLLTQKVTSGAAGTTLQLKKLLDLDVSTQIIRSTLRKASLRAAVEPKKPFLSKAHQKQWLEFALEHQHWTLDDWSRVVWSDETKINRRGLDGRAWVWDFNVVLSCQFALWASLRSSISTDAVRALPLSLSFSVCKGPMLRFPWAVEMERNLSWLVGIDICIVN